ncbi:A disintegrin and metalloproteinase with thrombospondin motifs 7-like isoform X2 [Sitophilus oryzae]|nr:A disintegrin and metalloproteinase with thrombospondin motifs 7-like isoform X2 [Sitophilus oryzae]
MTLMNGVNDLYRDNSTGQLITVEVVRVIYLEKEEEEIDLEVSGNALKTLESFGRWVNRINQPIDSPTHHDVGILLSKFDLCINSSTKEGCEITGLAKTATACKNDGSAACITEDMGLGLYTVIIAHEIGHLLGLVDDQKERHCSSIDPTDGSHYVMSPHTHVYTIKWSECSREDFKSFFQTKQSECLDDEPTTNLFPYVDNMPGVIYNENDQCRIMFPESNGACHPTTLDFCSFLICRTFNNTKCTGIKGQGPVDGTKCADSKWCYKQKCVAMGSRPGAINGGWSDWTDWSPCSRTCGGGVTYRERYCSNPTPTNRGKYCIGDRKSVKLCNTQLCPEDSISFREQQCKEQDLKSTKSENITYHWTAVYNFDSPCTLICFTKGLGLFNFGNAKDGTLCNPGTRNLCIAGHCKTVGCDLKINSEAIEDRCGICNGDGTTCRLVDGIYNEEVSDPKKMPPDQAIANIPVGSRKIFIKELEESVNILAISDKNKKEPTFFLNKGGNSKFRGSFKLPGTKGFYYTKGKNMEQDHIVIDGPTSIDLVVWLMYFKNNIGEFSNPGYHYQWAEPEERNKYDPVYSWEIGEYGDCSARCGGGVQEPIWSCMEEKGGMVSPTYCIGINKPTQHSKKCNEQSCHTRWNVGSWGKCHACKKKGGVRTRSVQCLQQNPNIKGESILVEDSQCTGPKPGSIQLCESDVHCTVRKKRNVFIPGMHQSSVWKQMNRINIYKREIENNQSPETPVESNHEEIEHISTLEPNQENNTEIAELKEILKSSSAVIQRVTTKFVVDKEPLNEQEIIEFELIHHKSNISDNKMKGEELGDILGTTKLFTGIELEELKHELEFKHRIVHSIPTTETTGTKTFKTTTEKETKTKSIQNQNSNVH